MADVVRAADLPNGTVVANTYAAWMKSRAAGCWRDLYGHGCGDNYIDTMIAAGAQVLRVGTGEA